MLLLIAALVKASGGPALFSHERVGRGGRRFGCLKFRSMTVDSAERLEALLATDPDARAEWEATRKLKHDPRVTTVGRFLRASSLDELPQLINVLRGEMSLVGPRPVQAAELASILRPRGGGAVRLRPARHHRAVAGERAERHQLRRARGDGPALPGEPDPGSATSHPAEDALRRAAAPRRLLTPPAALPTGGAARHRAG